MRRIFFFFIPLVVIMVTVSMSFKIVDQDNVYKQKLSDYDFFRGVLKLQIPANGVYPYELNSPLFSDYAHKLRFISLPDGSTFNYNPDSVFQFPVGTSIVKTFYYLNDERNPEKGRRLMETRILLHEADGWKSLPYIWNDEQTEAELEVAGGTAEVLFKNERGEKTHFLYSVPNMNQCKSCHERNGTIMPIGPSARQLNKDHEYDTAVKNQLRYWADVGILKLLPEKLSEIPALVDYRNQEHNINDRAKAYLDINCAHCHNKAGQAQTSGLYLDWKTTDQTAYGFYKTPIAAGRGSGDLKFDIDPGKPDESILLHRMKSTDPGVMMPELSRSLIHQEGVELISEWIKGMKQ